MHLFKILTWNVKNNLILIIGKRELILPSIINGIYSQQPFIALDGKVVYRVDKNSLYFPHDLGIVQLDRALLKDDITRNPYNQKESSIITSRGCMYNCAFCGGAHNLNKDV